ncbi:hypothetical protein LTR37_019244 [Vermiconidia calcicola]|uniref:Uncharacterized protein n=1 Tax=Vermiconidia calcicola TaxID=1690605 RepID=A0ACC3MEI9_9PEZI|nr:hypothetical protein LTR37_019244 [Vermiconidia calcicola]
MSYHPPKLQLEDRRKEDEAGYRVSLTAWIMLNIKRIACALLLAIAFTLWSYRPPEYFQTAVGNGGLGPLKFTSNGTFQISIFEDLHFGENAWAQWGPQQDIWSTHVMNQVLDAEKQQIVVLNGDLITGENTFLENSIDYIDQIVAPLVQRNIPFASTYGNHDSAFNLSREDILGREWTYSNSLTSQMVYGEKAGVSNYYLPVFPSNGSITPCLLLWFFDSRGGFHFQQLDASGDLVGQPNWVDQSVVDWFKATNDNLVQQYGTPIPSLAFVHTPTDASRALQTEAGIDAHHQPGINDDYPLAQQGEGWCPDGSNNDSCDYGGQDVPFIEAIASTRGFIALFSGHDHGDTWCYKWDTLLPGTTINGSGINLCFGQHSGYGGYGSWTRGSRQVRVTETMISDLEIETWIRLETGEVVGDVVLNSTYGRDRYPATEDTHTHCPTCE